MKSLHQLAGLGRKPNAADEFQTFDDESYVSAEINTRSHAARIPSRGGGDRAPTNTLPSVAEPEEYVVRTPPKKKKSFLKKVSTFSKNVVSPVKRRLSSSSRSSNQSGQAGSISSRSKGTMSSKQSVADEADQAAGGVLVSEVGFSDSSSSIMSALAAPSLIDMAFDYEQESTSNSSYGVEDLIGGLDSPHKKATNRANNIETAATPSPGIKKALAAPSMAEIDGSENTHQSPNRKSPRIKRALASPSMKDLNRSGDISVLNAELSGTYASPGQLERSDAINQDSLEKLEKIHKELKQRSPTSPDRSAVATHDSAGKLACVHKELKKRSPKRSQKSVVARNDSAGKLENVHKELKKRSPKRSDKSIVSNHDSAGKLKSLHQELVQKRSPKRSDRSIVSKNGSAGKLRNLHRELKKRSPNRSDRSVVSNHDSARKLKSIHKELKQRSPKRSDRSVVSNHGSAAKLKIVHKELKQRPPRSPNRSVVVNRDGHEKMTSIDNDLKQKGKSERRSDRSVMTSLSSDDSVRHTRSKSSDRSVRSRRSDPSTIKKHQQRADSDQVPKSPLSEVLRGKVKKKGGARAGDQSVGTKMSRTSSKSSSAKSEKRRKEKRSGKSRGASESVERARGSRKSTESRQTVKDRGSALTSVLNAYDDRDRSRSRSRKRQSGDKNVKKDMSSLHDSFLRLSHQIESNDKEAGQMDTYLQKVRNLHSSKPDSDDRSVRSRVSTSSQASKRSDCSKRSSRSTRTTLIASKGGDKGELQLLDLALVAPISKGEKRRMNQSSASVCLPSPTSLEKLGSIPGGKTGIHSCRNSSRSVTPDMMYKDTDDNSKKRIQRRQISTSMSPAARKRVVPPRTNTNLDRVIRLLDGVSADQNEIREPAFSLGSNISNRGNSVKSIDDMKSHYSIESTKEIESDREKRSKTAKQRPNQERKDGTSCSRHTRPAKQSPKSSSSGKRKESKNPDRRGVRSTKSELLSKTENVVNPPRRTKSEDTRTQSFTRKKLDERGEKPRRKEGASRRESRSTVKARRRESGSTVIRRSESIGRGSNDRSASASRRGSMGSVSVSAAQLHIPGMPTDGEQNESITTSTVQYEDVASVFDF